MLFSIAAPATQDCSIPVSRSELLIAFCSTQSIIENLLFIFAAALSILTREREPKKEPVIEARKILEENKLPGKHLSDNIQSDCGDKSEDKPKDSQ